MEDLLKQIKSDNEDIKLKLDAILNALIIPHLGEDKTAIKERIRKQIRGKVAQKIWNSINGQRSLAEIGKKVKQKPQVVLRYIKRWEQTSPPIVYVCMIKEGAKIYKRVFEFNFKKPPTEEKPKNKKQKESPDARHNSLKD